MENKLTTPKPLTSDLVTHEELSKFVQMNRLLNASQDELGWVFRDDPTLPGPAYLWMARTGVYMIDDQAPF